LARRDRHAAHPQLSARDPRHAGAAKKKPQTRQLFNLAGIGALGGAFWGLLFGLLFFIPLLGAAIGAATGALSGAFSDIGIDDNFIGEVREKVTPGTSALFLMSSDAVLDRVADALKGQQFELIATTSRASRRETTPNWGTTPLAARRLSNKR